jgi:hypothetical protein
MGNELLVEVHVLVESQLSVSEGHMIGDRVRADLLRKCDYVAHVLVHVDPEDDESRGSITLLPGREEMLARLEQRWRAAGIGLSAIRVNFHYLKGVIDVEIVLPLNAVNDLEGARRLSRQLVEVTQQETLIGKVEVHFLD